MEKEDTGLYRTLGIDVTKEDVLSLTDKDIASAYRKAALRWHPDKNRGDKFAADIFSKVFLAYETLSSSSKRKQYDNKIRQIRARQKAYQQQDVTRRRMRQQLHEREMEAAKQQQQQPRYNYQDDNALFRVEKEIERLRKDALKQAKSSNEKQSRKSSAQEIDDDFGFWASIPGFKRFQANNPPVPFEHFEKAILEGTDPF